MTHQEHKEHKEHEECRPRGSRGGSSSPRAASIKISAPSPRAPAAGAPAPALGLALALALAFCLSLPAPASGMRCSSWAWRTCMHLGKGLHLISLNPEQGSGLDSPVHYSSGIFSVDMKLHPGDTSGVIFAWYLMDSVTRSNREFDHAEIDFEFYGNSTAKDIMLATNVYADHKQNLVQFKLPWDPSAAFHNYAVQYNHKQIIWFIDGRPIRILNREPGQPWPRYSMQPQATIWKSTWTGTANFTNGPITAQFATYKAAGCAVAQNTAHLTYEQMDKGPACEGPWNQPLTELHLEAYRQLHEKHLIADYGWDLVPGELI